MGYYTGNGVVTGGGEVTNLIKSFYWNGGHAIRQKNVSAVTRKSGVSLATAQAEHATDSLTGVGAGSGTGAWTIFDCEGTRKTVNYSRIGDSNLFDLTITNETLSAWHSSTTIRSLD